MKIKKLSICLIATIVITSLLTISASAQKPKYMFLLIGDGMATSQRAAAQMYKRLNAGVSPGDQSGMLTMNKFPVKGVTTTTPKGGTVTDSAAAATALACGEKTKNGVVGLAADRKRKLKAFTYDAKSAGKKIGIITSVNIDHATPACFYANQKNRGDYYNISIQIAKSGFDFFAGQPLNGTSKAKKRKKPLVIAREAGYKTINKKEEFEALTASDQKVIVELKVPYAIDAKEGDVSLADFVKKGIEVLDNDNGFLMIIEGGKIDWTGHANDIATNVKETIAFDNAVNVAYDFYKKHKEETLIVVTGDHETGGMQTTFTGNFSPENFFTAVNLQKTSGNNFTTIVRSWGANGVSTEAALNQIADVFGLDNISAEEKKVLLKAIKHQLKTTKRDSRAKDTQKMYGKKNAVVNACQTIMAKRCGIAWTTFGHSSAVTPTSAIGIGAELFAGKTDNTDIAKKFRSLIK